MPIADSTLKMKNCYTGNVFSFVIKINNFNLKDFLSRGYWKFLGEINNVSFLFILKHAHNVKLQLMFCRVVIAATAYNKAGFVLRS